MWFSIPLSHGQSTSWEMFGNEIPGFSSEDAAKHLSRGSSSSSSAAVQVPHIQYISFTQPYSRKSYPNLKPPPRASTGDQRADAGANGATQRLVCGNETRCQGVGDHEGAREAAGRSRDGTGSDQGPRCSCSFTLHMSTARELLRS